MEVREILSKLSVHYCKACKKHTPHQIYKMINGGSIKICLYCVKQFAEEVLRCPGSGK